MHQAGAQRGSSSRDSKQHAGGTASESTLLTHEQQCRDSSVDAEEWPPSHGRVRVGRQVSVASSRYRRTYRRAAGAKVARKVMKKLIQERWNAIMWG